MPPKVERARCFTAETIRENRPGRLLDRAKDDSHGRADLAGVPLALDGREVLPAEHLQLLGRDLRDAPAMNDVGLDRAGAPRRDTGEAAFELRLDHGEHLLIVGL